MAKLISKKQLSSKIKACFETAISNKIYFPSIISILPTIYLEEKTIIKPLIFTKKWSGNNIPNEFSYYKILSELHFRKRDYDSASDILSKLIEIAPFKSDELIQPIEQILKKIPRHNSVRILFANILFRAFKPDEGCEQISTLLKFHPHKKEEAIEILKKSKRSLSKSPRNSLFDGRVINRN